MNKSLKALAAVMLLSSTAMAPFAVAQDATGTTTTARMASSPFSRGLRAETDVASFPIMATGPARAQRR